MVSRFREVGLPWRPVKDSRMLIVDEEQAQAVLETLDVPALVTDVIHSQGRGDAVVPVRASLRHGDVWFAAMPALIAGRALGAKLVAAFPANAAAAAPTHQAVVILLDPHSGVLDAIVAAEALTRYRTTAMSIVATRLMAARAKGRHAILGAGAQGNAHLDAFARAGLIDELAVWSRTPAHAGALAARARTLGLNARTFDTADAAVAGCDVVTTTTGSEKPLFGDGALAARVHVNAIGACVCDKREIPPAFVVRASIAVDSRAAARVESGDLLLALAAGAEKWNTICELDGATRGTAPTLFVSLGIGSVDVAVAAEIVARVRAASGPS